jgi:hypothetical protein
MARGRILGYHLVPHRRGNGKLWALRRREEGVENVRSSRVFSESMLEDAIALGTKWAEQHNVRFYIHDKGGRVKEVINEDAPPINGKEVKL